MHSKTSALGVKITIFWTWYVWLVTWACLAEIGHEVMCIDIDEEKIENLKKWIIPIYEPWLKELVLRNYKEKRLSFSTDAKAGVKFAKAIFSAVWTPPDKENHNKADLKYVKQIAKTIWENLTEYKLLINKSTVPVWTGKICRDIIKKEVFKHNKFENFDVASNPEFLREWNAIWDFLNPDRIVCWVANEKSRLIMEEIYKPFKNTTNIIFTDIKSAEIIKYAANSFLATKISFINEIANFAEKVWWNINDISLWIWADSRIWDKFLNSWIWYWWSCFPKDIKAFIETAKDYDYDFQIIKATEKVNKKQKVLVVNKLLETLKNSPIIPFHKGDEHTILKWKTISIWWLAFKPETDDIRDAPSIDVIKELLKLWVDKIKTYDPIASENMKKEFNWFKWEEKIKYCKSSYDALVESDALIILTEWWEFLKPNIRLIRKNMKWNIIIDWRNIWNEKILEELDFIYKWIWQWN